MSLPNFCLASSNFSGLATDLTKDVCSLTWITFQKPVEKKAAVSFALNCRFASVYSSELFREYRFANSRFIEFCGILGDKGFAKSRYICFCFGNIAILKASDECMNRISNA